MIGAANLAPDFRSASGAKSVTWSGATTITSGTLMLTGSGTIQPGNLGAGTITIANLIQSSGSILDYQLGSSSDLVTVTGDLQRGYCRQWFQCEPSRGVGPENAFPDP